MLRSFASRFVRPALSSSLVSRRFFGAGGASTTAAGVVEGAGSSGGKGNAARLRHRASNNAGRSILSKDIFRCTGFCTSSSYSPDPLLDLLSRWHFPSVYSNDIIHVDFNETHHRGANDERPPLPNSGEAFFFFKDGCVICWNMTVSEERSVLESLRPYETDRVSEMEMEEMDFAYGKNASMRGDTIILSSLEEEEIDLSSLSSSSSSSSSTPSPNTVIATNIGKTVGTSGNSISFSSILTEGAVMAASRSHDNIMEKIAFSYGLQRSVKLAVIESMVDKVIESVKHVPQELIVKKKLHMSSKQVMHRIGQLLYLRASLNMHSPLSETPEIYWEQPEFERLYNQITKQLDLNSRITITNSKIDYSQELVEVLRTHLSEKRGTNMEIAIIALIFVEVVFEVMHWMGVKTLEESRKENSGH